MNRRQFLRGATLSVPLVVAPAAVLEALQPKRSIFLPPRGGWFYSWSERWNGWNLEGGGGGSGYYRFVWDVNEDTGRAFVVSGRKPSWFDAMQLVHMPP